MLLFPLHFDGAFIKGDHICDYFRTLLSTVALLNEFMKKVQCIISFVKESIKAHMAAFSTHVIYSQEVATVRFVTQPAILATCQPWWWQYRSISNSERLLESVCWPCQGLLVFCCSACYC